MAAAGGRSVPNKVGHGDGMSACRYSGGLSVAKCSDIQHIKRNVNWNCSRPCVVLNLRDSDQ